MLQSALRSCLLLAAFQLYAAEAGPSLSTPSIPGLNDLAPVAYEGPAFLPKPALSLMAGLSQSFTNGQSLLGTFGAPTFPLFLGQGGTASTGNKPWGARDITTNMYHDPPETGVTRKYTFTITKQIIAPDGVEKQGIVANGAFPGPTIEADWGDWIEATVINGMTDEGTSIHWHGILQKEAPWMDGVPGVQQCPIAPGKSFTYRFKADLYGSSWWHSHYLGQYSDGLFGALIIHGPRQTGYDVDLGPVLLTDHFHDTYHTVEGKAMGPSTGPLPPLPPPSQNNLINGKMNYPCSLTQKKCIPNAGISKFKFQRGKRHLLRLINAGSEGMQKFTIDEHTLTVIATDFIPVQPYDTTVVTLGVGQRVDVIVNARGGWGRTYWMRSTLGKTVLTGCSVVDSISPTAVAAVYYDGANTNAIPFSIPQYVDESACRNDPLTKTIPLAAISAGQPSETIELHIDYKTNGSTHLWYINDQTFKPDYSNPTYIEARDGQTNFPADQLMYNLGDSSSVRFVIYNHAFTTAHPMHMHGHNVFVLAEGYGTWDGKVTNEGNPTRRDTQLLWNSLPGIPSYLVVQIEADSPGVWPFHCHIATHAGTGLYINLLEKSTQILGNTAPVELLAQTCQEWRDWTGN